MSITDKGEYQRLKTFLDMFIPFAELKAVGFFNKDVCRSDYEKIAERVRSYFGLKSIYDYKLVCRGKSCDGKNCDGRHELCSNYKQQIKFKPFRPNLPEMLTKKEWLN